MNPTDKEIADLNKAIQNNNNKINSIFFEMGKAYYNTHPANPDPSLVQFYIDLAETMKQNENMDTRIKFLRGIVVCSQCKTENSVQSSFCANCGAKLPHKMSAASDNVCPRCGNAVVPGQRFCGICGSPVGAEQPVQESQPAEAEKTAAEVVQEVAAAPAAAAETVEAAVTETVETVAEVSDEKRFCPNCGAEIKIADAMFCAECGQQI